jgi:hypothetical protein
MGACMVVAGAIALPWLRLRAATGEEAAAPAAPFGPRHRHLAALDHAPELRVSGRR